MRWGVVLVLLIVGCGADEPAPTAPAPPPGPSPATLEARGAAKAAREEWRALREEHDASVPPAVTAADAVWEQAEAVDGDDDAARAAYENARRQYRAAIDAAREEQAAAAEKLYLATVDARSRARALRQRIEDVIEKAAEPTADKAEAEVAALVRERLDTQVFPGPDRVEIDTKLEKANVFFEDKRYGPAKGVYDRIAADLEARLAACAEAEPFIRAARAAGLAKAERELSAKWLRDRNVPEPDAMTEGAEALEAAAERLAAEDWKAARLEFERAEALFKRAVAQGAALVAALEEATKTQRAAAEARARWQAHAEEQGIEATDDSRAAEALWKQGEEHLGAERYAEAAATFRRAAAAFTTAIESQRVDSIESLKAKRKGAPPLPGGSYASKLVQIAAGQGLLWLADHQDVDDDGKWDCDEFAKHDPAGDRCDGAGKALYDTGVTGLALLAFLRAGHLDRGDDEMAYYAYHVRRGLDYLRAAQAEDGVYGTRFTHFFMYNHAIATLAMTEAFRRTKDERYKRSAQAALTFIVRARGPLGWRYEPRGLESDTSVTAWCLSALHAGADAGLSVALKKADLGARTFVEKMTDPNFGQVGYNYPGGTVARPEGTRDRWPPERSQAMTAAGIHIRILTGERPRTSAIISKGANLCLEVLPDWNPDNGAIDLYYWYYGTLALKAMGGAYWRKWNGALRRVLVEHQHPRGAGARTGSWDPIGPWGEDGGRIYATAIAVLTLQLTGK